MKRSFFITLAAGAVSIGQPLLAKAENLTKRASLATNAQAPNWLKPCPSAVVWLDAECGTYYYKGDCVYGCTERGAYACEKRAIAAGYRAH